MRRCLNAHPCLIWRDVFVVVFIVVIVFVVVVVVVVFIVDARSLIARGEVRPRRLISFTLTS